MASVSGFEQDPCCINVIDADINAKGETPVIAKKFVKAMNVTPVNHSKLGNVYASNEQIYTV